MADEIATEAQEILRFDPFEQMENEPSASTPASTPAEPAALEPPATEAAPAPVPAVEAPATTPQPGAIDELTRLVREQQETIKSLTAKPAEPAKPQDEVPPYNFEIPPALVSALESENPAEKTQALAALCNGVAVTTHRQVLQHFSKVLENVPRMVEQAIHARDSQRAVFEDFYGTYKQFNNPDLYPTVVHIARGVMQQMRTNDWSPQVRDAVAKRVAQITGIPLQRGAPAPAQTLKPGTRPAAPQNEQSEILDVLFG